MSMCSFWWRSLSFLQPVQTKHFYRTISRTCQFLREANEDVQLFHQGAIIGNLDMMKPDKIGAARADARNEYGWTALMLAARGGHFKVVEKLVHMGCDLSLKCPSGQTAEDLAKFWNRWDCYSILHRQSKQLTTGGTAKISDKPFFSDSPLQRAAQFRGQPEEISKLLNNPSAKIVLFHGLSPVVTSSSETGKRKRKRFTLLQADVSTLISLTENTPEGLQEKMVFLGLSQVSALNKINSPESELIDDTEFTQPWFAADVSYISEDKIAEIVKDSSILPPFPGLLQLSAGEASVCGQARALLDWHNRFNYCPSCGSETKMADAGYKRICLNKDCRTNQGIENSSYPRLDPSIITLVIHPDEQRCLLVRQRTFPSHMYSCLAGFVEPGESVEEACEREVSEEIGVRLSSVCYHSSQPWPMPSVLMLGFIAQAQTSQLTIDRKELEDGRWFARMEAVEMLTRQHVGGLFAPPPQALAHQLLKTWICQSAFK